MPPLVPHDSNPGQVRMSLGGVGRNIAHNLCLLGTEVKLLTAFGDDVSAQKTGGLLRRAGHRHQPRPAGPRRSHLHLSLYLRAGGGYGAGPQ